MFTGQMFHLGRSPVHARTRVNRSTTSWSDIENDHLKKPWEAGMKKRSHVTLLTGFIIVSSILGCGSSSSVPSSQPVGADIIQKYSFHTVGQHTSTSITLP